MMIITNDLVVLWPVPHHCCLMISTCNSFEYFLLKNRCNYNYILRNACQPVQHLFRTSYYACHAGEFLSLYGLSLSLDLGRLQTFITTNYANWPIRLLYY